MQSTNVRQIKEAINAQTMRGTRQVWTGDRERVVNVKTVKGQLKARLLNSGQWIDVDAVHID